MEVKDGFYWDTALVAIPIVKEVNTDKKSEKMEQGYYS